MADQLPKPRLVRTTHAEDGTSVFASDSLLTPFFPFGPRATGFTILDSRPAVPVDNTAAPVSETTNVIPRCPPAGVVMVISDLPPHYAAPMHRTVSLDYAVVLSGEIVLRLDGGEEKAVGAGGFIVQQGVNHEWINRGPEPCRILFVMVGSEKVVLGDGTVLEETVLGKKK